MKLYSLNHYSQELIDKANDNVTDYSDSRRGQLALQWLDADCPQSYDAKFLDWMLRWECAALQQELEDAYEPPDFEDD